MIVNTNMNALTAHNAMMKNTALSGNSMEKISSGLRITKAGDDAAGLAISEKMRSQIRGLDQANRNVQDGISLIQTAEGGMEEIGNILQRMRELSVQAGNGTNSANETDAVQAELDELIGEIDRIAGSTKFNGIELIGENAADIEIQAGSNDNADTFQKITISLSDMRAATLGVDGVVSTDSDAAIVAIDTALETVNTARATLGAQQNRLEYTQNNLTNMSKINQQISTGKVINTVSDDPHKAIKIMNINNEIKYTEKYNYNIDESVGWMNTTDGALDNVGNLLGEIKETILKVGNGTYSQNEMKSLNEDMNEKIKQLADTLNSTHGGKYLFGGSSVDDAPITVIENPDGTVKLEFSKDKNGQTIPNTDDLKADISSGINIDYNISVGEILNIKDGNGNTVNLLDEINNLSTLMNDIANGDEQTAAKAKETLLNDTKGKIDTLFDHVVNERTSLGVRVSTAEKIKELNDEDILNIQDVLSKTQDTDVVEKFIELKSAEMIYQASIQVGAKLIQPTILDYIR